MRREERKERREGEEEKSHRLRPLGRGPLPPRLWFGCQEWTADEKEGEQGGSEPVIEMVVRTMR